MQTGCGAQARTGDLRLMGAPSYHCSTPQECWRARQGSNLQLPVLESGTLPIELLTHSKSIVGAAGFEPANAGLKGRCITALPYANDGL